MIGDERLLLSYSYSHCYSYQYLHPYLHLYLVVIRGARESHKSSERQQTESTALLGGCFPKGGTPIVIPKKTGAKCLSVEVIS
jgi:hypothetical protein